MNMRGIWAEAALAAVLVAGWVEAGETKATGNSLYDRLGGKGAIVVVVDTFVGKVGGINASTVTSPARIW